VPAADGSAGFVNDQADDHVSVPLGLVALNWLRLYLPLVREDLPQTPTNRGPSGLGFAKEAFRTLLSEVSASDLRIGGRFTGSRAKSVHAALREAAQTIDRMPSTFMTYRWEAASCQWSVVVRASRRRSSTLTPTI
jgi:hypothetical protein